MIGALSTRLTALASRIESRGSESAAQRLARWLADQTSSQAGDFPFRIVLRTSKKALAEELGMTPETLSRTLRRFRNAKLIEVGNRTLTLLRPATSHPPARPPSSPGGPSHPVSERS
jgi:CRP-like cAMP-binding protein